MTFPEKINSILQNDESLKTAFQDAENPEKFNIYSTHLPDELDQKKPALVFNYKKTGGENVLDFDNALEDYNLFVILLAPDTSTNETNLNLVRTLLDDFEDEQIRDIIHEDDDPGSQDDKKRYFKMQIYKVIFQRV